MSDKSLFCPYPWMSLCAETKGVLTTCSISNETLNGRAYPSPQEYKDNIRNSTQLKKLRLDLLKGVKNSNCDKCWKAEESGLTSLRQHAWRFFKHDKAWGAAVTASDGSYDGPLEFFDIRPGHKCNLKCRMCSVLESSAWQSDHEFLTGQPFDSGPYNLMWGEDITAWKNIFANIKESLTQVESIHIMFVGGEPLMEKNHLQFLQECVAEKLAAKIDLRYTSNITILPDEMIELWKHFRKVMIGTSFDGLGAVNDYIRYPSQWKTIEKNLNKLLDNDSIFVWTQTCVTLYNVFYIPEIYEWAHGRRQSYLGEKVPYEIHSHLVHEPPHLSIYNLSAKALEVLEEKFSKYSQFHGSEFLQGALTFAKKRPLEAGMEHFWDYTQRLDERRRQSFAHSMPEWHDILRGAP